MYQFENDFRIFFCKILTNLSEVGGWGGSGGSGAMG